MKEYQRFKIRRTQPKSRKEDRRQGAQHKPSLLRLHGRLTEQLPAQLEGSYPGYRARSARGAAILRQLQHGPGRRTPMRFLNVQMTDEGRPILTRMLVGPAGDKYEREADRVARAVVAFLSSPRIKSVAGARVAANGIRRQQLARRPLHARGGVIHRDAEAAIRTAKGGGRALPNGLKTQLEAAFGADFRRVRIHTGVMSNHLNRFLGSAAFTTGKDIFFRRGFYRPDSNEGKELLAHELTHVIQQRQR
ncbi:MAG: DUF4157 domain-containing protein [Chloroflexota bacterium]|nr:DUF4157 domain-containing protein [Chloroflexota bacterium]